jgi:hypothetical protein
MIQLYLNNSYSHLSFITFLIRVGSFVKMLRIFTKLRSIFFAWLPQAALIYSFGCFFLRLLFAALRNSRRKELPGSFWAAARCAAPEPAGLGEWYSFLGKTKTKRIFYAPAHCQSCLYGLSPCEVISVGKNNYSPSRFYRASAPLYKEKPPRFGGFSL